MNNDNVVERFLKQRIEMDFREKIDKEIEQALRLFDAHLQELKRECIATLVKDIDIKASETERGMQYEIIFRHLPITRGVEDEKDN